jgi:phosphatase NudJ
MRVIYLAEPIDDTPPKTEPDDESLGAAWVTRDELANYSMRGDEVAELFAYVANGGVIHAPDLIQAEGAPYRTGG